MFSHSEMTTYSETCDELRSRSGVERAKPGFQGKSMMWLMDVDGLYNDLVNIFMRNTS